MNPQLIADLEAARALIDTPEKWGKGVGCIPPKPPRCCVCSAVGRSRLKSESDDVYRALGFQAWDDAALWNDAPERTHAEVMELFDKAIANERSKA